MAEKKVELSQLSEFMTFLSNTLKASKQKKINGPRVLISTTVIALIERKQREKGMRKKLRRSRRESKRQRNCRRRKKKTLKINRKRGRMKKESRRERARKEKES